MTVESVAVVATDRAARFGKQLAAHLGRRGGGDWSEETERGWVALGEAALDLTAVPSGLHLSVRTEDADELDRLEDVVGRHLVRFSTRERLVVDWTRSNGAPGTHQETPLEV